MSQSPNCKCSLPASLLTVQKEGPNKGRKFYTCSKRSCKYFEWALPSASSSTPSPSASTPSPSKSVTLDSLPIPSCQKHPDTKCKLLQVVKDGPTKGRLFWSCGAKDKCNHFKWFEGDFEKYKHLVINLSGSSSVVESNSAPSPQKNERVEKEPVIGIVMSPKNRQNNWVGGMPQETMSDIFSYLPVYYCVKFQQVCKEWQRMLVAIINNPEEPHVLNLGFLNKKIPFSDLCSIFLTFLNVKQVTFCNFVLTSELMRLLEWTSVETLVFYNCSTELSSIQEEHTESEPKKKSRYWDFEQEEFDWGYYHEVRNGFAPYESNLSKDEITKFKKTLQFRQSVTNMCFSRLDEEKEQPLPGVDLKHVKENSLKKLSEQYKTFAKAAERKLGNFGPRKRFENLKRMIIIDPNTMKFCFANKDRKVYFRNLSLNCSNNLFSFLEASQVNEPTEEEKVDGSDWEFSGLRVQHRIISILQLQLSNQVLGAKPKPTQVYNGIECDSKMMVPTQYAGKYVFNIVSELGLEQFFDVSVIDVNNLEMVKLAVKAGIFQADKPVTKQMHSIADYYLTSVLRHSKQMVSCDLDEIKNLCKMKRVAETIELLVFLNRESNIFKNGIPKTTSKLAERIDSYWNADRSFIEERRKKKATVTVVRVGPVNLPFSWIHLLKTGEFQSHDNNEKDNNDDEEENDEDDDEMEDEETPEEDSNYEEEPQEEDLDYEEETPEEESSEEETKKRKKRKY